ncbi:FAD-dependent oxidoreductase [Nocardioides limicola]|uniref:FAD-dependent oxidoreductase n=1 Tax=Nocardioides limicola TaxID=2803368 RepID=UPI00193B11DD|nr:FAD-dependent oxidoreductase [Nocardioides sp. DJM-14]
MTRRLVIVGNGMAAVRLVEQLVALDTDWDVTVLGDEPHPPYNRILLSAVLEGTHRVDAITLRSAQWYADAGVTLRTGARVLDVDTERSEVMLVDGERIGYDRLVLATGSIPTLPPIRGLIQLDGSLHPDVHAFRSLADCLRLDAAVRDQNPQRAVVVGGGLLGLQVARALSIRGVATEIVEGADHLLSRQVDVAAGEVLTRDLKRLGTEVYTGARAIKLTPDGLRLDNGYTLATDLIVLTAGGRPSTALARRAGLEVRRGVVVDEHLASVTDPRIHALGDCAQFGDETTGFVGPAWDQAGVLARHLAGVSSTWPGARNVARLRATGLEVAVLGNPEQAEGEVVSVSNPIKGTHRKLVVRDGRLVAATLIGDLSRVGLITQLYDRGTRLGRTEPGDLLLPERRHAPAELPDDVEVCACAGVTAGAIRSCSGLDEVRSRTRATTGCGGCAPTVRQLLGVDSAVPVAAGT